MTLFGFCQGLRSSETIAIESRLESLDRSGLGNVLYRRAPGDVGRCPIDRVEEVRDLEHARAIVAEAKSSDRPEDTRRVTPRRAP